MTIGGNKYDELDRRSIAGSIADWTFMDTEGIDNCLSVIEDVIGPLDFEDYESPETLENALMSFDLETLQKLEDKIFNDFDVEESDRYEYIKSKSVMDSDGFYTDYTMYYDRKRDVYVFIFGDNDIYDPTNESSDWEAETRILADKWFNDYNGFDDGLDESFKLQIREKISDKDYSQSKTGKAYKVFQFKNGKLYPPMVANAGGQSTPVGVWLDAEPGEFVELDGMKRVVQKGRNREKLIDIINSLDSISPEERKKQVQTVMGATLAYRPGWHLGDEPRAAQFDRNFSWEIVDELPEDAELATVKRKYKGVEKVADLIAPDVKSIPDLVSAKTLGKYIPIKSTGQYAYVFGDPNPKNRQFFPYDFVWAECDYIMDVDYQEEAHQSGVNDRQVNYKLLPEIILDENENEYQVIQFKQGDNLFYVTFNDLNDIRIDGYPFDSLESAFSKKDYVQKEVQNYFLNDNMDIIERIIKTNSKRGKETMKVFSHRYGDLQHLPIDGSYKFRTNPNPDTVPWVITSAIKVNKLLDDFDVERILGGNAPERQGGNKTLAELGLKQI